MQSLQDAARARHAVRQYIQKPLTQEQTDTLRQKIDEVNKAGKLHIQLITNDPKVFDSRIAPYGKFSGVEN